MTEELLTILNGPEWTKWPGNPTIWTTDVSGCEVVVSLDDRDVVAFDIQRQRGTCTTDALEFAYRLRDRIEAALGYETQP